MNAALQDLLTEEVYLLQPSRAQLAAYRAITDPKMKAQLDVLILVCQLYVSGEYTVTEACAEAGITAWTLGHWVKNFSQFWPWLKVWSKC